jgi:hypothetical protein
MATTTNFGWETPDDTDLVKDGAAAIRTALGGVDTSFVDLKGGTTGQVLAKASATDLDFVWSADAAGMTNPMTTTGDTIYSSSGSTPARLGIGSTGNVLTVAGGVPTWAAPPAAPADNWTLLSTTNLPTGASSLTISGISGQKQLMILCGSIQTPASSFITLRINGDTGSLYTSFGSSAESSASYNPSAFNQYQGLTQTSFRLLKNNNSSGNEGVVAVILGATNSTGAKTFQNVSAGGSSGGGNTQIQYQTFGVYTGSSAVTSITLISSTGNFRSAIPVYLYGTA